MLWKILTFLAGAAVATVITLWVKDQQERKERHGMEGSAYDIPDINDLDTKPPVATDDSLACVICLENAKSIVFQPCGHVCSCQACAIRVNNCPMCRARIERMGRVYLA